MSDGYYVPGPPPEPIESRVWGRCDMWLGEDGEVHSRLIPLEHSADERPGVAPVLNIPDPPRPTC